jgi:hypothetical protein
LALSATNSIRGEWAISTMNNKDDFSNNEEQSTTPVGSYAALLEMTRPLLLAKGTVTPCISFVYRDQPDSLEAGNCQGELALKRGQIVRADMPEQRTTNDEGTTAAADLAITSSDLRIRVYIGMS